MPLLSDAASLLETLAVRAALADGDTDRNRPYFGTQIIKNARAMATRLRDADCDQQPSPCEQEK